LFFVLALGLTPALSAQAATTPQAGHGVEISGVLLLNAYYSDDLVNNREVPWLASPRNPFAGDPLRSLGSTVRQSRLVLSASTAGVAGARMDGEVDIDFYGADAASSRSEPVPRVRRMVGRIAWPNVWVLFGQETLPISPLDPSTFAAVSVPGFTGSGNLSRWMPQIRVGVEIGNTLRIGVEAAAVAPRFNKMLDDDIPEPDPAELSKRPFVQGRLLTRWETDGIDGEVSAGGHYGWFTTGNDSLGITRAAAAAARVFFKEIVELKGEAFLGEGLGMLGGGGIDQTLSPDGRPVRTSGGWAQINVHLARELEFGGAYGIDNPHGGDLDPVTGRSYNMTWRSHCHFNLSPWVIAIEYQRIETTYSDAVFDLQTANHLNLALGFEF
jgi:hypothetical protein